MTIAIFQYEKVLKTTQNVPKTVDNHQEQLVLGLGYQFFFILASKKAKKPNFMIRKLSPSTTKML